MADMEAPKFTQHYRTLFKGLRRCGLANPWIEQSSLLSRIPFVIYDGLTIFCISYMLCCYGYSINAISIRFQELCGLGVSAFNFICAILVTVYLFRFRHRLRKLTDSMDQTAEDILSSALSGKDHFLQMYQDNANLMAHLTDNSIFLSFTCPFIYCSTVPFLDWIGGRYRSRFPFMIANPFDDTVPGVYELILLVMACSLVISTCKKAATDCLFVSLFNIQSDFLKYLSLAMQSLKEEQPIRDNACTRRKLVIWLKLHQDIVRNTHELVEIFSPVVIIYYFTMIGLVVCGAFVQSMKENEHIIQSITIGGYISMTLVYYYLLSNTADELTTEAKKLAMVAYDLPWYQMSRTDAGMIQLIITISNMPISVTAYRAPKFLLNRETFGRFLVGAISAFVTLCQMKTLYD